MRIILITIETFCLTNGVNLECANNTSTTCINDLKADAGKIQNRGGHANTNSPIYLQTIPGGIENPVMPPKKDINPASSAASATQAAEFIEALRDPSVAGAIAEALGLSYKLLRAYLAKAQY